MFYLFEVVFPSFLLIISFFIVVGVLFPFKPRIQEKITIFLNVISFCRLLINASVVFRDYVGMGAMIKNLSCVSQSCDRAMHITLYLTEIKNNGCIVLHKTVLFFPLLICHIYQLKTKWGFL